MEPVRPTPTVEDYLGVIYILERDGEPVFGVRLTEWLHVSAPTVTATVRRMIRDGWVTMDRRKEIRLTPSGREAAVSLLRRHILSELLLARVVGVPWSQVHSEAHEMEHTISDDTMKRIALRLQGPTTCPHGNPLPGHEGLLDSWVPLTQAEAGQRITVKRVHEAIEQKPDVMLYLDAHNLVPDTEATVTENMPFNETISLQVGDQVVVLGYTVAERIYVQAEP